MTICYLLYIQKEINDLCVAFPRYGALSTSLLIDLHCFCDNIPFCRYIGVFLTILFPNWQINYIFYISGTNGEGNVLPAEGNKYRDIWKQVGLEGKNIKFLCYYFMSPAFCISSFTFINL